MKKPLALFLILAFAAAMPCFIACDKIEDTSIKEASDESRELVLSALQKLDEDYVDFTGMLSSSSVGSAERIYDEACSVAPEIRELDSRDDGALALLEEYESLLERSESSFGFANVLSGSMSPADQEKTDRELLRRVRPIEGLFARRFYEKLDENGRERFLNTLCAIYNNHNLPHKNYEDVDRCYAYFFICGGGRLIVDHETIIMNGEVYFKKS